MASTVQTESLVSSEGSEVGQGEDNGSKNIQADGMFHVQHPFGMVCLVSPDPFNADSFEPLRLLADGVAHTINYLGDIFTENIFCLCDEENVVSTAATQKHVIEIPPVQLDIHDVFVARTDTDAESQSGFVLRGFDEVVRPDGGESAESDLFAEDLGIHLINPF